MKNVIFISFLFICARVSLYAQDQEEEFVKSHAIFVQLGFGVSLSPVSEGFASNLSLQYIEEDLTGLGIELGVVTFTSPQLDRRPDASLIMNFDPAQNDYPNETLIDGSTRDSYKFINANYTHGFKVLKRIQILLHAGPSLVYAEQQQYTYTYSGSFGGGFGGFSFGGGGPHINAKTRESTKVFWGGHIRVNTLFKVSRRSVFSISPFININTARTISGVQLGFVIGKGFKNRIF